MDSDKFIREADWRYQRKNVVRIYQAPVTAKILYRFPWRDDDASPAWALIVIG
jgi:hypothetical protein